MYFQAKFEEIMKFEVCEINPLYSVRTVLVFLIGAINKGEIYIRYKCFGNVNRMFQNWAILRMKKKTILVLINTLFAYYVLIHTYRYFS